MRRHHMPPLLLWSLFCLLSFFTLLTGAKHLPFGDLAGQFHAFGLFQARELLSGHWPTWSPGSYAGVPFTADTQAAVFYPPRWLTILLSAPWDLSFHALQLEGVFHIWLAGTFTYGLAYSITRERFAGLVAALAFGLGGYLLSYPLLQIAILETITWLPLILLVLRKAVSTNHPLPWLVSAGTLLGISALAGHPQTLLQVIYMATAYYLFLTLRARWRWLWILGGGGGILAIAAGTSTAAWLPALRYLAYTTRSTVTYDYVAQGFPLLDYIQLLVPGTLSFWSPQYVGMATVLLTLLAWRVRKQESGAEITFWGLTALVALWLSLGDKGVLFELAYRVVPGFSLFRQQERVVNLVSLSMAMLAAQGLSSWLRASPRERIRNLNWIAWLAGGSLLCAGLVLAMAESIVSKGWLSSWLRQWVVVATITLLLRGSRFVRARAFAVVLMLGFDLYVSVADTMHLQSGSPNVLWPRPAWMRALASDQPSRIDSGQLFYANIGEVYSLEDVRGLSPLKPQALADLEQLPRARRWQLLNVTHVVAQGSVDSRLTEVGSITESLIPGEALTAKLYRFEDALPRSWMSYEPVVVADAGAALQTLQSPDYDPATQVVLHTALEGLDQISTPRSPPQVNVLRQSANWLTIEVDTESPGILVISEWAYPGWRATVDGEPVSLHTADYALQGLLMSAGSHKVEMRFSPVDVQAGVLISLATIVGVGAVALGVHPQLRLRRRATARLRALRYERAAVPGTASVTAISFVLLVAFGLRIHTARTQELRGDEAFSYMAANQSSAEIVSNLVSAGETLPPFHYLALHGWLQAVGKSELAMRMLSIMTGLLSLSLAYRLGRQLRDRRLGLLTLLGMTLAQSLIWVSQDVRSAYAWALLFELVATLLLLAATRDRSRYPRLNLWVLYAFVCALTIYSHYYGIFALFGHGLYLMLAPGRRRYLGAWIGSGLAATVAVAPWPLTMWPRWLSVGHLSDPAVPDLSQHLVGIGQELAVGNAFGQPVGRWLFVGGVALCALGVRRLRQEKKVGWAVFFVGWLVSAALVMYVMRFRRSTFNDYYISLAAPAWWILVAVGLHSLWLSRSWRLRALGTAAAATILASAALSLGNYYLDPSFNRTLGFRPIAEQIARVSQPNDVVLSNAPDPSLSYYLENVALPRAILPSRADEPPVETEAGIQALALQYDRIWFVPDTGLLWDKDTAVDRWLNEHALLEWDVQFEKLQLQAYRPLRTAEAVMKPIFLEMLDESGESLLSLNGAFVSVDGVPAELTQLPLVIPYGALLQVTLLWEAKMHIPTDYTVFVHLLDARGAPLIAQHDGTPFFALRHTSTWQPGERILDRHEFEVPRAIDSKSAVLLVGMYDSRTLERQPFEDGQDAVRLADAHIVNGVK